MPLGACRQQGGAHSSVADFQASCRLLCRLAQHCCCTSAYQVPVRDVSSASKAVDAAQSTGSHSSHHQQSQFRGSILQMPRFSCALPPGAARIKPCPASKPSPASRCTKHSPGPCRQCCCTSTALWNPWLYHPFYRFKFIPKESFLPAAPMEQGFSSATPCHGISQLERWGGQRRAGDGSINECRGQSIHLTSGF